MGISVSQKTKVRETNVRDEHLLCAAMEKDQRVSKSPPSTTNASTPLLQTEART